MSNHGGKRAGAGRPRKFSSDDVLKIGLACEAKYRQAADDAVNARLAALPAASEIRDLQNKAQAIPVADRRRWTSSDAYKDHLDDLEAWLHFRAGTQFNEETNEFVNDAPRVFSVSKKPPRGTRQRIIDEVATEFELQKQQVDNLWQEYRRIERYVSDADES